jgi:hypothetical protein
MLPTLALPTGTTPAAVFARLLARCMGPAYQAADGTRFDADLRALATGLAQGQTDTLAVAAEAFVREAVLLLAELESSYGLAVRADLSDASRQARLLAKLRAGRAGTPQEILRAVQVFDAAATLAEVYWDDVDTTVPSAVFRFAVRLTVAVWSDSDLRGEIQRRIDQMKPAHTKCNLHTNEIAVGFRTDDPLSLTDRDVLRI